MISDISIKVDRDLCFACGICVDRCIMDNLRLSVAPCRQACPLNLNCQGYLRLIAQDKEEEAARELRKYTPFAGILGRICSRPCETACERGRTVHDGAVNIRALKRYLDEKYPEITRRPPEAATGTGHKAAVIGSGPAGLMAAYELAAMGHQVTVFEAKPQAGGLLRCGVPVFRLPISKVDAAVKFLEGMGVEFLCNRRVGKEVAWSELEGNYGAIIVAMGAGRPLGLDVPGEDQENVIPALELLAQAKTGQALDLSGRSVVVVGGGNTAADTAMTCLHCGAAEVRLVCLESPREMPAYAAELREARELGVIIENGWGVGRIDQTSGGKLALSLNRCLSVFHEQGGFAPLMDDSSGAYSLEADLVAVAIGQTVDPAGLPAELGDASTGRFLCDEITRQSIQNPKLFFCGDCAPGSGSVVEAFATGKRAAESAGRFLLGENLSYQQDYYQANGLVTEYQALP